MILHEGGAVYIELSTPDTRCPKCRALLARDGSKYFHLFGLHVIERPRPGLAKGGLKQFGLAREHSAETCAERARQGRKRFEIPEETS